MYFRHTKCVVSLWLKGRNSLTGGYARVFVKREQSVKARIANRPAGFTTKVTYHNFKWFRLSLMFRCRVGDPMIYPSVYTALFPLAFASELVRTDLVSNRRL